jgi:hypothetical protein
MSAASLLRPAIHRTKRLGISGKALIAREILVEYARVWWSLRRRGLRATLAAVDRPVEGDDPRERLIGLRMGRAVDRTLAALPSDSRCLIRAVVLARVLARRGVGCRVVLGVKTAPAFSAHAWVEYRGLPLLPAGDFAHGRLTEL